MFEYRGEGVVYLADYSWDDKATLVGVAERNGRTVELVPTDGGKRTVVNSTWFSPSTARISPDGKWLAFASGQSGPFQVYRAQKSLACGAKSAAGLGSSRGWRHKP